MKRAKQLGSPTAYTLSYYVKPTGSVCWQQVKKTVSKRGKSSTIRLAPPFYNATLEQP